MGLNGLKEAPLITSFKPLAGRDARVLVLGSMPGQASLEQAQYYAHPQNVFWWIMSELFGFSSDDDYQQKVISIIENGVAVWDVLAQCERQGSLDSSIKFDSEVANPIIDFLQEHQKIKAIFLNGQKAAKSFEKHIKANIANIDDYQLYTLPSTSPAHASLTKYQKLQKWQLILKALDFKQG